MVLKLCFIITFCIVTHYPKILILDDKANALYRAFHTEDFFVRKDLFFWNSDTLLKNVLCKSFTSMKGTQYGFVPLHILNLSELNFLVNLTGLLL